MRVLLTHAYSAENLGDGLLVAESVDIVRSAFPSATLELVASDPDSFDSSNFNAMYKSKPSRRGYNATYIRMLTRYHDYDLIVAVGGGYIRFGTLTEAFKTAAVHGPQLVAAAMTRKPTVYLPQSIGPWPPKLTRLIQPILRRMGAIYVRDPRSVGQVQLPNVRRAPDLALLQARARRARAELPSGRIAVGTRELRPSGAANVGAVVQAIGLVDGMVQSTVGSNNDVTAVSKLSPVKTYATPELCALSERRLVISVRLHGALMALMAGHTVIHLSYERKGFGAFEDLGLSHYVHNVYGMNIQMVADQCRKLMTDIHEQRQYDALVTASLDRMASDRETLIRSLQHELSPS